jgi:hypothetical protein
MAALTRTLPTTTEPSVAPFVEGDTVHYIGTNFRSFTVARCYSRTLNGETRWIVGERNADSHDPAELERIRTSVPR